MKGNKGQVEISFNWIFVLVAGGLLLMFFIMFIVNQQDASEEELGRKVITRLDTIFTIIQQTPDSVQSFERINTELIFSCEEGVQSYRARRSSAAIFIDDRIVFSPNEIGVSSLIAWTKSFRGPYPVTPVLYLSDEKTQYVFVNENNLVAGLFNQMPAQFSKILVQEHAVIRDDDYRRYIIITSRNSPEVDTSKIMNKYDVVSITASGSPLRGQVFNINFVTEEMLWGAIITGDPELFKCARDRLLARYRNANKVQIKRVELIRTEYEDNNWLRKEDCKIVYDVDGYAEKYLNSISGNLTNFDNNYNNIADTILEIQSLSTQTERPRCAKLY